MISYLKGARDVMYVYQGVHHIAQLIFFGIVHSELSLLLHLLVQSMGAFIGPTGTIPDALTVSLLSWS